MASRGSYPFNTLTPNNSYPLTNPPPNKPRSLKSYWLQNVPSRKPHREATLEYEDPLTRFEDYEIQTSYKHKFSVDIEEETEKYWHGPNSQVKEVERLTISIARSICKLWIMHSLP